MKRLSALVVPLLMACGTNAGAQTASGVYVSVSGGANFISSADNNYGAANLPGIGIIDAAGSFPVRYHNPGPIALAAVGYGFGNGFRIEVEGGYRSNKLNYSESSSGPAYIKGDETKYSLMANLFVDFGKNVTGLDLPVTPYLGGGAGLAWISWDGADRYSGTKPFAPPTASPLGYQADNLFHGTDTKLATQLVAGFSYTIPSLPKLSVSLDYRWMYIPHFTQKSTLHYNIAGVGELIGPSTNNFSRENNHGVVFGLRYNF